MKLANRLLEQLLQKSLTFLWEKYRKLPGEDLTTAEFQRELSTLMAANLQESLQPQSREFGILVSDLRGFTPIAERYPPLAIVELLNHYYRSMIDIIDFHGGVVDKFMGDSVMAVFDSKDDAEAPRKLLSCVIDMQLAMDDVNDAAERLGLPSVFMGIGINYGSMVICELGSEVYRELTVLGDEVNFASRLTAYCLRGQVLMSDQLYQRLKHDVVLGKVDEVHLKGKSRSVTVYEVLGQKGLRPKLLPVRDSRKSYRVLVDLPVTYFMIEDKHVSPAAVSAQTVDLSQQGMKMVTTQPHGFMDEIKIVIPLLSLGSSSEIYAKVVFCRHEDKGRYGISVEFTYIDEPTARALKVFIDQLV